MDRTNNPLKNAPHTAADIASGEWDRPYSREEATFPAPAVRLQKFWPAVRRVDHAFGDRNLVCACPPVASYGTTGNRRIPCRSPRAQRRWHGARSAPLHSRGPRTWRSTSRSPGAGGPARRSCESTDGAGRHSPSGGTSPPPSATGKPSRSSSGETPSGARRGARGAPRPGAYLRGHRSRPRIRRSPRHPQAAGRGAAPGGALARRRRGPRRRRPALPRPEEGEPASAARSRTRSRRGTEAHRKRPGPPRRLRSRARVHPARTPYRRAGDAPGGGQLALRRAWTGGVLPERGRRGGGSDDPVARRTVAPEFPHGHRAADGGLARPRFASAAWTWRL